jgi:hypothetical protein
MTRGRREARIFLRLDTKGVRQETCLMRFLGLASSV